MDNALYEQQFFEEEIDRLNKTLLEYELKSENNEGLMYQYQFLRVIEDIVKSCTCPIECFELAVRISRQFPDFARCGTLKSVMHEFYQSADSTIFYPVLSPVSITCPLSKNLIIEPVSTLSSKTFDKSSLLALTSEEERQIHAEFGVMYKNDIAQLVIKDWNEELAQRICHKKNLIDKCIQYLSFGHRDDLLMGVYGELLNLRKYMLCANLSVLKYRPINSKSKFVKKPILVSSGQTFEEDFLNKSVEKFGIDYADKGFKIPNKFLVDLWKNFIFSVRHYSRNTFILERTDLYSQFAQVPYLRYWTLRQVLQLCSSPSLCDLVQENVANVGSLISFLLQRVNLENHLDMVLEFLSHIFTVEAVTVSRHEVLNLTVTTLTSPFNSTDFRACVKLLASLSTKWDMVKDAVILDQLVGPLSSLWRIEECFEWEDLLSVTHTLCSSDGYLNIMFTELFTYLVDRFHSVSAVEDFVHDPVYKTYLRLDKVYVNKWIIWRSPFHQNDFTISGFIC